MTTPQQWQPIETAPNDVVDLLCKYYDAGLDRFLYRRVPDCVQVNNSWYSALLPKGETAQQHGYRPICWMPIPELPASLKSDPLAGAPNIPSADNANTR